MALTFDAEHPDRPSDGQAARELIARLRQLEVAATFFVQGRWAEAYPQLAARLAPDGHLVGSHSFYHARMPLFDQRGFRTDVRAAERAIRMFAGTDPRPWFRMPFGSTEGTYTVEAQLLQSGVQPIVTATFEYGWAH